MKSIEEIAAERYPYYQVRDEAAPDEKIALARYNTEQDERKHAFISGDAHGFDRASKDRDEFAEWAAENYKIDRFGKKWVSVYNYPNSYGSLTTSELYGEYLKTKEK